MLKYVGITWELTKMQILSQQSGVWSEILHVQGAGMDASGRWTTVQKAGAQT